MRSLLDDYLEFGGFPEVTHDLREGDPSQFRRKVGSLVKASKELKCGRPF